MILVAIEDIFSSFNSLTFVFFFFFFQAEDGIRDLTVTGVQTCALPISRLFPGTLGHHPSAVGHGLRFPGEGVLGRGARGDSTHERRRTNYRPHLRRGEPHGWTPTLGRHGLSQGGARVVSALLRRGTRQTWHHGERDQPRLDREQRIEHAATSGPGSHQELARARLDAHGTFGNAGRCRQRGDALLFGASRLDHRTSDLRGWRCLVDESRGPPGDTTGITARQEPARSRSSARPNKCLKLTAPVVYGRMAFVIIRPWPQLRRDPLDGSALVLLPILP